MNEPDYEAVLGANPDLLLTFSPLNIRIKAENLPGVDVVFLNEDGIFLYPAIVKGEGQLAGVPDQYYESAAA